MLRRLQLSISQTFLCLNFFPFLCFATLSYYFSFNCMPFILVQFSCIERCLVNKGRRKAIKMGYFLINSKLPRAQRHKLSAETYTIITMPMFGIWSHVSTNFHEVIKSRTTKDKYKQKAFKMWNSSVWSMIGLSHMFTCICLSEIQSCGGFVFATSLLWKGKKKNSWQRNLCYLSRMSCSKLPLCRIYSQTSMLVDST